MAKSRQLQATQPPRRAVRVGALDTLAGVRVEMSRVYRAARRACGPAPSPSDAAKLGFLLQAIGRCIVDSEMELRLRRLEQQNEEQS
jgi:hypothetical protein